MKKTVKIIMIVAAVLVCGIMLFPVADMPYDDGATTYYGSILSIYRVKVVNPIFDKTTPIHVTLELFGKEIYDYEIENNISNTKVNLGTSELYSEEELQLAADSILDEIGSWDSVKKVYDITYCGDEISVGNLDYCNMLDDKNYTQCVVFESSFKSADSRHSGGFNPDSKYTDWQWYLAKADDGEWNLLTWGY